MTADVPPGPARRAGIGIVMIARMSGRPIVPCAAATSRFRALNTWSRMTINLPGSKLAYVAGDPIWVSADAGEAELEFARLQVERALNAATARAYELVGADVKRVTPPNLLDAERPARRSGFPPQGLPCQHEPAASHRAAHPQDPRAQRQGGSASPRRAARPRDDGASQRRAVLGARGQRRRDERRAAGHRSARQGAPRSPISCSRPEPSPLPAWPSDVWGRAHCTSTCRSTHRNTRRASSSIGGRTWQCLPNPRSGRRSSSKPRRATFPSRSSTRVCRTKAVAAGNATSRRRCRCSAASASSWRRTTGWLSASRRSAPATFCRSAI